MFKVIFVVIVVLTELTVARCPPKVTVPASVPNFEFKHHNHAEMKTVLNSVQARCPKITKLFKLPGKSVLGKELWGIVMGTSPNVHQPLIPEFKYVSSIHGNEVVGKELLLALAVYMCNEYRAGNQEITKLLSTTRIHLLPIINPDGWDVATASSYEDRNVITGRANKNGFDLNRNFPNLNPSAYRFETENPWNNNHLIEYAPFVEIQPETKAMMLWMDKEPFVLSASLHGGAVVAVYPYDSGRNPDESIYTGSPDDELFRSLSSTYANANPKMINSTCDHLDTVFPNGTTNGAAWYSLEGGMQDYSYLQTNCLEITLEMECIKYPTADRLQGIWQDHLPALLAYMWQVHTGIKGIVVDGHTNAPIKNAIVHVQKLSYNQFQDIWHDITSNPNGDYYRLLVDGVYNVQVFKKGYNMQEVQVIVDNNPRRGAQVVNFLLTPLKSKI